MLENIYLQENVIIKQYMFISGGGRKLKSAHVSFGQFSPTLFLFICAEH